MNQACDVCFPGMLSACIRHIQDRVSGQWLTTHVMVLQHKATYITLECKQCHTIKQLTCKPGIGGAMIPRVCDAATMGGEGNSCGQDPFLVIPSRSQYVDQQTLKLQVSQSRAVYTCIASRKTTMQPACCMMPCRILQPKCEFLYVHGGSVPWPHWLLHVTSTTQC